MAGVSRQCTGDGSSGKRRFRSSCSWCGNTQGRERRSSRPRRSLSTAWFTSATWTARFMRSICVLARSMEIRHRQRQSRLHRRGRSARWAGLHWRHGRKFFLPLDAKTSEKKWTATAGAEIDSAANFYHDNVLFGSQDNTLYCDDAKTGQPQWKQTIGDQIRCSPTVVQDVCFLAGCDGKLHVIDLHNSQETGAVEIAAPTGSTPAASGDLIYFGTEGAPFFCIDWKQLKKVWSWQDRARGQSIGRVPP